LSNELYDKFVKLIYKKTGIFYELNKKYYVEKRIENRALALKMVSTNEYYQQLKFTDNPTEYEHLINDLTINETYFFRDFPQLCNFAESVLPVIAKQKKNNKKIKIWSAACSTGEEPYTLSIILQEMLDDYTQWDIQILATDINTEVLQHANIGLYDSRSIKDVPPEYLEKYFTKSQNKYLVNLQVRRPVTFKRLNLFDTDDVRMINGCDVIFCRNCLIYFDDESRSAVLSSFYKSLNPGGMVFLGHSESVGRISSDYQEQRIGDTIVYSRPKSRYAI
jgi:chemotaxis protein methyltransferase CheR